MALAGAVIRAAWTRLWSRLLYWPLLLTLALLAAVGAVALYSAAGGDWSPWAMGHLLRFAAGLALLLAAALVPARYWLKYAYLLYAVVLAALLLALLTGDGARRWLDLGLLHVQPSELMKIALILALARRLHNAPPERLSALATFAAALAMTAAPVALIALQPDLSTAVMTALTAVGVVFVAGVSLFQFSLAAIIALAALPFGWSLLHAYQQQRLLTFLDPLGDPLGAGYHILQSQIAFGAGGLWGKGLVQGSQSQLNFLPEKHTDFIFTLLAEETGLAGALAVLALFALAIALLTRIALQCRHVFGQLTAFGLAWTLFLSASINTAMASGLLPVAGAPLPFVSYGGSAMASLMFGFGVLFSLRRAHATSLLRGL